MQDTSQTWVRAGGNVAGQVCIEKSECRTRVLSKTEVARSWEQSRGLRSRSSAAGGQRRGDCVWRHGGRAGCARSPWLAPAHGFGSLRVGTRPDSCWTPASHGSSPTAGNRRPRCPRAHGATGFPTVTGPGGAGNGPPDTWAVGTRAGSRPRLGRNRQESRAQGTPRASHSVRGGRAPKIRNSANFCECGLKTLRPGVRDAETSHWTCLQLAPGPPEHCGSEASGGPASLTPRRPPAAEHWGQGRVSPLLPLAPEPERRQPFRCGVGGGALSLCGALTGQLTSAPRPHRSPGGLTRAHGVWGKKGPEGARMAHPSCGGRRAYLPLPGPLPSSHTGDPGGPALENLTS